MLIASHAALRAREATALHDSCLIATSEGLLVKVPGRRSDVGIRPRPGSHDPADSWVAWLSAKHAAGLTDPKQPAFSKIRGNQLLPLRLGHNGLNYIVHAATRRAALKDPYPFTSLRSGWIRDAARSGMAAHDIAAGAGMAALTSVVAHERRENLLRDNIANRLGL